MNRNEPLHFDFMLQVRYGGEDFCTNNESIDNMHLRYGNKAIILVIKIAKITILAPQPEVDSDENKAHCEKSAFTLWHSLVEHQPIGSINRLRKDG